MSHLSEKGQRLFKEYLNAKKAWYNYIKDIANSEYNKQMDSLGKKYGVYDYIFYNSNKNTSASTSDDKKTNVPEKTKKLYRKLSCLFHPDKFSKTDKIFITITNYMNDNEFDCLDQIDKLSTHILDCSPELISFMASILSDKIKLKQLYDKMISLTDKNEEFDLNQYLIMFAAGSLEESEDDDPNIVKDEFADDSCCGNLLASNFYQWFMSDQKKRKFFENQLYSEDELIEHLRTNASESELNFYHDTGNSRIIDVVHDIYHKQIDELKKTHDDLATENFELINKKIDELLQNDTIHYHDFSTLHGAVTNKKGLSNESKQKYQLVIDKIASKIKLNDWDLVKFFELGYPEINRQIISLVSTIFNQYLELPPFHKHEFNFFSEVATTIDKCYAIIIKPELKELTDKILPFFCQAIKSIDLTDIFVYNKISGINDPLVVDAIENNFNQLCLLIPTTDYTKNNYKFSILCEFKHVLVRQTALKKLTDEKDIYIELYNKYFNL